MTIHDVLAHFRNTSLTEKDKGTRFERIIRDWFKTDPRYSELEEVWMWEDFPSRKDFGGKDTGIDLVARTEGGEYWAIQCKCYDEKATIDKPAVDSFLATSSKTFTEPQTLQTTAFSARIWVSTTSHWGTNAEETIKHQSPQVTRINLFDLETSPVDWQKLFENLSGKAARSRGKSLMKHQLEAISAAYRHYEEEHNERGKLIMACGTGKTFTSLKLAENLLKGHGLVLFLVPSISLLGQTLNSWAADSERAIKAICVCSDNKASRKIVKDYDDLDESPVDLALPASTDPQRIMRQLKRYKNYKGLVVVFSTYQSIDVVQAAQQQLLQATGGEFGTFDLIVSDEAHRTTGVKLSSRDESNFTKVHDNDYLPARRRLYMTATPRLYSDSVVVKVKEKDPNGILCSMDDETIYGKEFYRLNFAHAVQAGLLTDYKVLVLTVSEEDIPGRIRSQVEDSSHKELNYDDTTKLIGVINGLSKKIKGDNGLTWQVDPRMMRRAVAFCSKIGAENVAGSSKNVEATLPKISEMFNSELSPEDREQVVNITTRHIDGSMNSQERNERLAWLKQDADDPKECRVVTNVRCLSEGIDVPALDAVIFLSPRNSQVDVVQSVGRVMRNFRKGKSGEKKYGYIIIPIVVPMSVKPEDALNDNKTYAVVWDILNALRAHDDQFNAHVNSIALNKKKDTEREDGKVIVGGAGIGVEGKVYDPNDRHDAKVISDAEVARQLELRFGELQTGIYAKLVEKCGDRMYWENWASKIGVLAKKLMNRIKLMADGEEHKKDFQEFVKGLQKNLNPSVDEGQAIEMLAQHIIIRPVFDALFSDYQFVNNNVVSRTMQRMVELLQEQAVEKDTEVLDKFYSSVRVNISNIDNLEGKQTIIKNIFEKFFKGAFPLTVEKLGIVYTPVECVDFIIHSVDDILRKEFNTNFSAQNVHVLDPFTGTGTFITRLLQSGLIRPEDMERKYLNEIHCNEIVLLAYYIADVNIEAVFHDLVHREKYLPYDGICLTDTFQLGEPVHNELFTEYFQANNERVEKQKHTPVRVIIGNPPYSVGQKSANDNAQNLAYPHLDARIAETYAAKTDAALGKSLYDSYIKAFRWASDRIPKNEGGIVAFISNGAWIDGNAQDGMRRCLEEEFSKIYVLNLRGNCRTSGELRKKEGDGIFDQGSRTPISITILVKKPSHKGKAEINYHDIGDYLKKEQKLDMVKDFGSISSSKLLWENIQPNDKADWINQRDGVFDTLVPIFPQIKFRNNEQSVFSTFSSGCKTGKDSFLYSFSNKSLEENARDMIDFYNENREKFHSQTEEKDQKKIIEFNSHRISWDQNFIDALVRNNIFTYNASAMAQGMYRPFTKQCFCYDKKLIQRTYRQLDLFPTPDSSNLLICVSGVGVTKPFSCIITNQIPDLELIGKSQCFPLYYYEENKVKQQSLFDENNDEKYIRRDGITDWILKEVRNRYSGARNLTKEHIFYYVYGLLHSEDYRTRFADDLKKSLPRIPIVESAADFMAFYNAGKQLAAIHLGYESEEPWAGLKVEGLELPEGADPYEYYRVEKMRFPKKGERSTIIFNPHIRISNIPEEAYQYVVNGKSAIEWLMERYAITTDKASGIRNDPNDWAREHNKPRYILDLMRSIVSVSMKTVEIVNNLPRINFE